MFVLFPHSRQVRATVIGGVFAVLAPTLGPVVGCYITETSSWHWLFRINLAPGIHVSLVVGLSVRAGRPPCDRRRGAAKLCEWSRFAVLLGARHPVA